MEKKIVHPRDIKSEFNQGPEQLWLCSRIMHCCPCTACIPCFRLVLISEPLRRFPDAQLKRRTRHWSSFMSRKCDDMMVMATRLLP